MSQQAFIQAEKQSQSSTLIARGILQDKCNKCERKLGLLQPKATALAQHSAPTLVNEVLRSPGELLAPATRAYMEPRFGHDFSNVKVHADERAAESAREINALAYTEGHHVVFGTRKYAPSSIKGLKLLAHELTHVVQQQGNTYRDRSGKESERKLSGQLIRKERDTSPVFQPLSIALPLVPVIQAKLNIAESSDKFEQEADRVADMVMRIPEAMSSGAIDRTSASIYPSSAAQRYGIECGHSGVVLSSEARTPARMNQTIRISHFDQDYRELARKTLKEEDSKAELEFRSVLHFNSTFSGFNPTGNPKEGDISIIWWKVWNTGWKTASEHTNRLTIYKADLCSGCRHEKDEIFRSEISAPSIVSITQQGESDYENAVMIGGLSPGHYDAYAELDVYDEVEEINKDNNSAFMVFDVRPRSESESAIEGEEESI